MLVDQHLFWPWQAGVETYFQKIDRFRRDIAPMAAVALPSNHSRRFSYPASLGYLWLVLSKLGFVAGQQEWRGIVLPVPADPRHPELGNETNFLRVFRR